MLPCANWLTNQPLRSLTSSPALPGPSVTGIVVGAEHQGFLACLTLSFEPCDHVASRRIRLFWPLDLGCQSELFEFLDQEFTNTPGLVRPHRVRHTGDFLDVLLCSSRGENVIRCICR